MCFSEEKVAELKIRLDQAEKAKEVSSSTLQERIHGSASQHYVSQHYVTVWCDCVV